MIPTILWGIVYVSTFIIMEFVAWFSHKYIMHGFLWSWHKDHHKKDHNSWFEMNDLFFVVYAVLSAGFVVLWGEFDFWPGLPIALGIFTYGMTYFLVHDIFIHQRFKIFRKTNNRYAKCLRRAQKYITKTSIKKRENVLGCFGYLKNTSGNL